MRQKEREKIILREFKSICSDFPSGKIVEHEAPDFIVQNHAGLLGIDLVDYMRGQRLGKGSGGSELRREESNREKFIRLARKQFEARNRAHLYVKFLWLGHQYLKASEVKALKKTAADLIAKTSPRMIRGKLRLGRDDMAGTVLEKFVKSIHIRRVKKAQSLWTNMESRGFEMGVEEIQTLISFKDQKINAYLRKCNTAWLLIVADGKLGSSRVELPDIVRWHQFQSRFEKIIFYSRRDRQATTLISNRDSEPCGGRGI